jgi:MarR family 2-MHQ and catechol resistance regulon transcriptional repressor
MTTGPHIRLVLWKAAKAVERLDRRSIGRTGLKLTDFQIMEVLLHKGPLPINTIAGKVLLTSGSMTAAVNRLEKMEYVKRIQDPSDGRCFHVHLTAAGRRTIRRAYDEHARRLEKIAGLLSVSERNELVRLLKKVGQGAEALR